MAVITPTDLRIERTGERSFDILFTAVSDGAGGMAGYFIRSGDSQLWWEMNNLTTILGTDHILGQTIRVPVEATNFELPIGQTTYFKMVAGRFIGDEGIEFGEITGGDGGAGPAVSHTWQTWIEPSPPPSEIVPNPLPFTIEVSLDGSGVILSWTAQSELVTEFRFGLPGTSWETKTFQVQLVGLAGQQKSNFVLLSTPLVPGENIEVMAQNESVSGAVSEVSAPVIATRPHIYPSSPSLDLDVEPDLETDNPIISAISVEGKKDVLILTWADGSRAELRRLWAWFLLFDWFAVSPWIAKKLPPEE